MKTESTSQTPRKFTGNAILFAIIALALSASWPAVALADECLPITKWRVGTDTWFSGTNWDHGEPNSTTAAQINNGGTAQILDDPAMAEACSLTLGLNADDSGTVQVSPGHGDLIIDEATIVGSAGKGNLTITQGNVTSAIASIASLAGSSGSVTVDGAGSTWAVSGEADVGGTTSSTGGTGLLTVTNSATVTAASLHVYGSGTLAGDGTVTMTSLSAPVVKIDGGTLVPGTLTINGDLTFTSTAANMRCNVSSSSWDRAEVSGRATLNGKLSVTLNGFFTGVFPLLHASTLLDEFSSYWMLKSEHPLR